MKLSRVFNSGFLILSIVLVSSCTSTLFVSKPLPPEIELEKRDQIIVIQNMFDYTRPDFVKEKHSHVYKAGVDAFSETVVLTLADITSLTAMYKDTLVKSGPGRVPSDVLDRTYIKDICDYYLADLLLTFDSISIDFDWETERIEYDDGSVSKTKYFYLQVAPFVSLYNYSGELVDRSVLRYEALYSERPTLSGLITIKPALSKATPGVINLSIDAGREYVGKFNTSTGHFPYKVYVSKPFETAYSMMLNSNWSGAIRELLPLAESGDRKIAKKAAHNLWVAYNGIGDEVSASDWYNKSR